MKFKKSLFIILIAFFTFFSANLIVFADHECEYSSTKNGKKAEYIIKYSDKGKVSVSAPDTESLFKDIGQIASLAIVKYRKINSSSMLLTESVKAAISEEACPGAEDEVYVCYGTVGQLTALTGEVGSAVETLLDLVNWIWTDYDSFGDWLAALWEDLTDTATLYKISEVLIVSGSESDAKGSFGYKDGGFFDINWSGIYMGKENFDANIYTDADLDCFSVYYIGDKTTFNLNCPYLQKHFSSFQDAVQEYKKEECKNDTNCLLDVLEKIDSSERILKNECSSILQSQDYYLKSDTTEVNSCVENCLSMNKKIALLKQDAGLTSKPSKQNCGFSNRLMNWIRNILKWIKYILPVIVIVLGIIDFIKAIVSDKDDEMKKSQTRFIRRLIAAALVFLIPLIIEFILDKFGFVADGCGLF